MTATKTLKEFMKPAKVNEIIREYDLSKYDITLAVKSLRNCSRIGEFKELLSSLLKKLQKILRLEILKKQFFHYLIIVFHWHQY